MSVLTNTPYRRILYNELPEEYPYQIAEALKQALQHVEDVYAGGINCPMFLAALKDDPMEALEIFQREDWFTYYGQAQEFLTKDLDEGMHTPEQYGFDIAERILEVIDVIRFHEVEQLGRFYFDTFDLCRVANMFWYVIGLEIVTPVMQYQLGILKTLEGSHGQALWTILQEVNQ